MKSGSSRRISSPGRIILPVPPKSNVAETDVVDVGLRPPAVATGTPPSPATEVFAAPPKPSGPTVTGFTAGRGVRPGVTAAVTAGFLPIGSGIFFPHVGGVDDLER